MQSSDNLLNDYLIDWDTVSRTQQQFNQNQYISKCVNLGLFSQII